MIATLLRIFWIHLRRDRVVWVLTFFVPVAFFSIFAIIFSAQGRSSTPVLRVAVVDEDGSDFSKKLVAALEKEKSLRVSSRREAAKEDAGGSATPLGSPDAEALVRDGKVVATVHPRLEAQPNVLFARIQTPMTGRYIVRWTVCPEGSNDRYDGEFPLTIGEAAASAADRVR